MGVVFTVEHLSQPTTLVQSPAVHLTAQGEILHVGTVGTVGVQALNVVLVYFDRVSPVNRAFVCPFDRPLLVSDQNKIGRAHV